MALPPSAGTCATVEAAARGCGEALDASKPDRVRSGSAPLASRHIPSLDGIRAGSFLIVFSNHALASWIPGQLGVTVFFFLSGFLITTLLRAEYEKNGSVSLRHFWLRRALRILPPLYLVVLGSALLALAIYPPGTVHGPAVASQLLLYANYYDGSKGVPGTAVIWSLAVEEHFYLLFPLLYVAMQRWRVSRKDQARLLWDCAGRCWSGAACWYWRCMPRAAGSSAGPTPASTRSCSAVRLRSATIRFSTDRC